MNLRERRNLARAFRMLARDWHCPIWMVNLFIQRAIDESWEKAAYNPQLKALWDKHFPNGKPTPEEYILFQGRKFEKGEEMPELLCE